MDYNFLGQSALIYASIEDRKHLYVSSVYADFDQGFSSTLAQGGAKKIFLSNFIRLYRTMNDADIETVLDIYEAELHVFQNIIPNSISSIKAINKSRKFIEKYFLSQGGNKNYR